MQTQPTSECRIFLSRNTDDTHVSRGIRESLGDLSGQLTFFDDCDIEPGEGWRERLRDELQRANLLLLLLTKPSEDDFDWPLYEAGLFESLEHVQDRRVVCVYPDPQISSVKVPSQLTDKQAVKATESKLLQFLDKLFHDETFTNTKRPLNKNIKIDTLRPLARTIADIINDVRWGVRIRSWKYVNYYFQLLLPPDANSLGPDVEIESNDRSLQHLFGLENSSKRRWTWGQVTAGLEGLNRRWTEELCEAASAIPASRFFRQLSSMFVAHDGRVYRPGVEIHRRYENGRITIDVCFSEQIQDAWLKTAQPPVTLAAHLELATRIRYEVIEPNLRKIGRWRKKERKAKGFLELREMIEKIEHYEYLVGKLTGSRLEEAFGSMDVASNTAESTLKEIDGLSDDFEGEIKPRLEAALKSQSIPDLRDSLQLWKKNNSRFLEICLQRFRALVV